MLDPTFPRTMTHQRHAPLAEIQADLQEVLRYNAGLQAWISFYAAICTAATIVGVVCFLGIFAVAFSQNGLNGELPPFPKLLCGVMAASVVPAIFVSALAGVWGTATTDRLADPRRLRTLVEFLRHVGRDVPPHRRLRLYVDFRPASHDALEKSRSGPAARLKLKYSQRWLDLTGRLYDRTRFRLTVSQKLARKHTVKKRTRDRDVLREWASLVLVGKDPRPSLRHAPAVLNKRLRGRAKLVEVGAADGVFDATIESPVVRRDSAEPKDPATEPLFTEHELLPFFVTCHRIWRLARRPSRA